MTPSSERGTMHAMGRLPRLLLLGALSLGACLVGVELMITAVALPRILADITDWTQLRRASWIVNGYLLSYIATMPLAGRAADRFGLPALTGIALGIFGIGSLLAGAAQDLDQLIAARVLQGVGGGAIVPLATAGASHLYSGAARARALGIVGALTFLGMAIGPFAGATVLEGLELGPGLRAAGLEGSLSYALAAPAWRWIFYISVPLALLAMVYIWAAAPGWTVPRVGGRLDVLGAGLFTTALATGLLALTTLDQHPAEGAAPSLVGPLQLGVIALVTGVAALLRMAFAREPFFPLRYFRDRTFSSAVLLSLLTGYALATAIIGGAVFVDRVRFGGPEDQRIVLGSLAGAMAIGALASGFLLRRFGIVPLTLVGIVFGAAGMGILATATPDLPQVTLVGALALFGLGFGLTVTPRSSAAVEALGEHAFGIASAGVTVARMIGMALGLAVLTALGSGRIEQLSLVLTDQAARDRVLPPYLQGRGLDDALVAQVLLRWSAEQAALILGGLFLIAGGVMVVSIVPALAMRSRRPAETAAGPDATRRGAANVDADEGARAVTAF
jgi:MFS family permease